MVLTEYGEREQAEQQQQVRNRRAGSIAVHSVLLTGAHLNFELRVVG